MYAVVLDGTLRGIFQTREEAQEVFSGGYAVVLGPFTWLQIKEDVPWGWVQTHVAYGAAGGGDKPK
jgi:hypothetical protein